MFQARWATLRTWSGSRSAPPSTRGPTWTPLLTSLAADAKWSRFGLSFFTIYRPPPFSLGPPLRTGRIRPLRHAPPPRPLYPPLSPVCFHVLTLNLNPFGALGMDCQVALSELVGEGCVINIQEKVARNFSHSLTRDDINVPRSFLLPASLSQPQTADFGGVGGGERTAAQRLHCHGGHRAVRGLQRHEAILPRRQRQRSHHLQIRRSATPFCSGSFPFATKKCPFTAQ